MNENPTITNPISITESLYRYQTTMYEVLGM